MAMRGSSALRLIALLVMAGFAGGLLSPTPCFSAELPSDGRPGVLRLDDLAAGWFQATTKAADRNVTVVDDLGLSRLLRTSTLRALALGSSFRGTSECKALRAEASDSDRELTIASPTFRNDGVTTPTQLATISYQNAVRAFPSRRAALRFIELLRAPETSNCLKDSWRRRFEDLVRLQLRQQGGAAFVNEAVRHTNFNVDRTHASPNSIGFFGSYTTSLPEPAHFFGASVVFDFVQIGRFVVTYLIGNARASTTGDGDPGISQEDVDRLDLEMNAAALKANGRLRDSAEID